MVSVTGQQMRIDSGNYDTKSKEDARKKRHLSILDLITLAFILTLIS